MKFLHLKVRIVLYFYFIFKTIFFCIENEEPKMDCNSKVFSLLDNDDEEEEVVQVTETKSNKKNKSSSKKDNVSKVEQDEDLEVEKPKSVLKMKKNAPKRKLDSEPETEPINASDSEEKKPRRSKRMILNKNKTAYGN